MKKIAISLIIAFSVLGCTSIGNPNAPKPKIKWVFIENYACLDKAGFKDLRDYIFLIQGK